MSDQLTLSAERRERAGKGASRHLRREGRVPAVIYGNNEAPQGVHVEEKALMKALMTGHFFNSVVMIDVGGKALRTLPKDVQFHPVSDRPLHADFLRISEHATVTVGVPVHSWRLPSHSVSSVAVRLASMFISTMFSWLP